MRCMEHHRHHCQPHHCQPHLRYIKPEGMKPSVHYHNKTMSAFELELISPLSSPKRTQLGSLYYSPATIRPFAKTILLRSNSIWSPLYQARRGETECLLAESLTISLLFRRWQRRVCWWASGACGMTGVICLQEQWESGHNQSSPESYPFLIPKSYILGGIGGTSPILLRPKLWAVHPPHINPLYWTRSGDSP